MITCLRKGGSSQQSGVRSIALVGELPDGGSFLCEYDVFEGDKRKTNQNQDLTGSKFQSDGVERPGVGGEQATQILDQTEAVKLLSRTATDEEIGNAAAAADYDAICEILGNRGDAIVLAAAYLKNHPDRSPAELVSLLEEKIAQRNVTEEVSRGGKTQSLAEVSVNRTQGIQTMFEVVWDQLNDETKFLAYLLSTFPMTEIHWKHVEGMKKVQARMNPELGEYNPEAFITCRDNLVASGLLQSTEDSSLYLVTPVVKTLFWDKYESSDL